MDIAPVNNLTRAVDTPRREERQQPQRRQPQRKREKIAPAVLYTPDGHVEQEQVSKIDVVA